MPEFKANKSGISVRKDPIPSNKGFFGGDRQKYQKYALDTQSKEGSPAEFLKLVAAAPTGMTGPELFAAAEKVGMKGSGAYNIKTKVSFLLKKYGEKQPDGRWKVTKEIKPPFFSEGAKMPKLTEVFVIKEAEEGASSLRQIVKVDQIDSKASLIHSQKAPVPLMSFATFVKNPNGSYEAWPDESSSGGVDVYDPKKATWGNSDYMDDSWLDAATGIKNWRETIQTPEGK